MISASDRMKAIQLIEEAVASGARRYKACVVLHIADRTYCRWVKLYQTTGSYEDLRPNTQRPEPANKLTPEERQRIVDIMTQEKYSSLPPSQVVPMLADAGNLELSRKPHTHIIRQAA